MDLLASILVIRQHLLLFPGFGVSEEMIFHETII